jgi:hypothetical protein
MNRSLLLLILVLTFSAIGCKKTKDYRDNYTGNYNFSVHKTEIKSNGDTIFDSLLSYSGQILKSTQVSEEIVINYLPNVNMNVVIDQNGRISKSQFWGLAPGVSGNFETTDKVTFHYYLFPDSHVVTGSRK